MPLSRRSGRIILRILNLVRKLQAWVWSIIGQAYASHFAACGAGTLIHGPIFVAEPNQVRVGRNVHIGPNALLHAQGGLTIGDHTHIGRNLVVLTRNHRFRNAARLPYDDQFELGPVTIGRNVWIGTGVCIAPGTTIGDGAIIAAGTVVSGEVPPMAIVGSQKWRILGYRDQAHYAELDVQQAYGGVNGRALD